MQPSPCHLLKPQQDPSPVGLWLGELCGGVAAPCPMSGCSPGQGGGGEGSGHPVAQGCQCGLALGPGTHTRMGLGAGSADASGRQVTGGTVVAPSGLAGFHGVQGTPGGVGVTASSSCPGGLCTGAGRAAPAAKSLPGQPGGCPGRLGASGGGGLRAPLGRAVGQSVSGVGWGGTTTTQELLPALPGRCLRRAPGTRRHRQEQVWPARGSA